MSRFRLTCRAFRALCIGTAVAANLGIPAPASAVPSTGDYRIAMNESFRNTADGLVIGNVKDGWHMGVQRYSPKGAWAYGRIYGGAGFTRCGWVDIKVLSYEIGPRDQNQDCPTAVGDVGNAFNSFSAAGFDDGVEDGRSLGIGAVRWNCDAYENLTAGGQPAGVRRGLGPVLDQNHKPVLDQNGHPVTDVYYRFTTNDGQWAMVRDNANVGPPRNNWLYVSRSCFGAVPSTYPEFYVNLVLVAAANGQYMTAENGGGTYLIANRSAVGQWEQFTAAPRLYNNQSVSLRAASGQWVAAEGGGGDAVNANRAVASTWETFTVVKLTANGSQVVGDGDQLALRTSDGAHYLCADGGGWSPINATRTGVGQWETFTARFVLTAYP